MLVGKLGNISVSEDIAKPFQPTQLVETVKQLLRP